MSVSPELTRRVLSEPQWRALDYLFKRWVIEGRPRNGTHVQPSRWCSVQSVKALIRYGAARQRRDYTYTITLLGRRTALLGPPEKITMRPGRYVWTQPDLWKERV